MSSKMKKEYLKNQIDILKETVSYLYDVLSEIDELQKTKDENIDELFFTVETLVEQFLKIKKEETKYLNQIRKKKQANEYRKDRS